MSRTVSRRQLLAGAGLASAGVVAGTLLPGLDQAAAEAAAGDGQTSVPFDGRHQAGIVTPVQARMVLATYDVSAVGRSGLLGLLDTWTAAARRMTAGTPVGGPAGEYDPPPDTGEALGLPPSRLTLTIGFGPTLFDDRFGLTAKRPDALVELPPFAGDALDPGHTGGDLCIQACADDPVVAYHAVHNLTRLGLGAATLRTLDVGMAPTASSRPGQDQPRNLLGFHDGTANLDPTDPAAMARHVWVGPGSDQEWMTGGTYLVSRRIRIHLEAWNADTLEDQQRTIGRMKVSGAPLGGTSPSEPVDLAALGADGQPVIPNTAHIRLASPALNRGAAMLRRGYTFADGVDPDSGELNAGLLFLCFQRDPRQAFIPIQTRLAEADALSEYVVHTGSGIFACPPGVTAGGTWGHHLV